jgi:lipoprotein-anchoring transpeptidase ErfK/SrfK
LLAVNGIADARMLSIGRRIKIPKVDFAIEVDKSTNSLTLFNYGEFFARYPVRTGRIDYLTPVGEFQIVSKKKDPQWTDPKTHRTYAPLHPENELGTRWLGFQGSSLGIHGTIHPESIGSYASNGCVGMLKEDVEELYDLVRIGTPIRIKGEIKNPEGEAS